MTTSSTAPDSSGRPARPPPPVGPSFDVEPRSIDRQLSETTGQVQQIRDLLECAWPAALQAAQQRLRSRTWISTLAVIVDRDHGQFARTDASARSGSSGRSAAGRQRWPGDSPTGLRLDARQ
jgi:hypothetical protein